MITVLWLTVGLILGTILLLYARSHSARGEKVVLANALVVAAFIYVLFAIIWGNTLWLLIEIAGVSFYGVFVWAAIRYSSYWLAIGWLIHPIWDIPLHLFGPGMLVAPEWYAIACISFDILVAGYIFNRTRYWQQESTKFKMTLSGNSGKDAPLG